MRKAQPIGEGVQSQLRLLIEAEDGRLENLKCPKCDHETVSVWFTNPAADLYRTWFLCTECDFHSRAQNGAKPKYFSEHRIRKDLQQADASIFRSAKFKKPTR